MVDANILIKAMLGVRVRYLMDSYANSVESYTPDAAFDEAQRNLVPIAAKLGREPRSIQVALDSLTVGMRRVTTDDPKIVAEAKARIKRHPVDWPVVAAALELDCPIWTDDQDFFGCGVATWSTATVELYLNPAT